MVKLKKLTCKLSKCKKKFIKKRRKKYCSQKHQLFDYHFRKKCNKCGKICTGYLCVNCYRKNKINGGNKNARTNKSKSKNNNRKN